MIALHVGDIVRIGKGKALWTVTGLPDSVMRAVSIVSEGGKYKALDKSDISRLTLVQSQVTLKESAPEMAEDSTRELKSLFWPGSTVALSIYDYSNKGTTARTIKVLAVRNGEVINVSHHVARVLGMKLTSDIGVRVRGCGMDMAYSLISDLSTKLGYSSYSLSYRQI